MSAPIASYGIGGLNLNSGAGVQNNHNQSGGSRNIQYNGENFHFSHNQPPLDAVKLCLQSLRLTDPGIDRDNLIKTKGQRVSGTCEWIWNNEAFRTWLRGNTQLLWIHGGPGKGKTMLSIFLTKELEKEKDSIFLTEMLEANKDSIYYFCSGEDEKRNNACAVLRGLMWQIARKYPECIQDILHYLEDSEMREAALSAPETLWNMFDKIVRNPTLAMIFCVLDGLDECDQDSIRWLVQKLDELTSASNTEQSKMALRLVIVSRHGIPGLRGSEQVQLDPDADENINADIKIFVSTKVQELSKQIEIDDEFRDWVESVLLERAEGTFLWVGFAMIELLQKRVRFEVEEVIKNLPKGLFAIYGRMLSRISSKHQQTAAGILLWVATAFRPLSLQELGPAIGLSSSDDVTIRDWIYICKPFLDIKDDKVVLVHQSARDYLLREEHDSNSVLEYFRVKPQEAHLRVAWACIDCIQRTHPNTVIWNGERRVISPFPWTTHPDFNKEPLLEYAFVEWPAHARAAGSCGENLLGHPSHFFDKTSVLRMEWWEAFIEQHGHSLPISFSKMTSLDFACHLGYVPWVQAQLKDRRVFRRLVNQVVRRDWRHTSLKHAIAGGHMSVATLLLARGASIGAIYKDKSSPLRIAAFSGRKEMVEFLLDHGADTNAKDLSGSILLHHTASYGHKEVSELLLKRGASINATDQNESTPLHLVASNGNREVAELFLDRRASIDAIDGSGSTPLHVAAQRRRKEVFVLLLSRRARIDATSQYGKTLLHLVAEAGWKVVVEILLNRGANSNATDNARRTPLCSAAKNGHKEVVELLLNRGADIDETDMTRTNPLHLAAAFGREKVVEFLLDRGANIDAVDIVGRTALHCSILGSPSKSHIYRIGPVPAWFLYFRCQQDLEQIVQLLLARGANPFVRDYKGQTAMKMADKKGFGVVVQMFKEFDRHKGLAQPTPREQWMRLQTFCLDLVFFTAPQCLTFLHRPPRSFTSYPSDGRYTNPASSP